MKIKLFFGLLLVGLIGVTGLVVGLILGLLLARPEIREKISARTRDLQERVKKVIEESKPALSQSVERGRRAAMAGLDKAKEKVEEVADALQASLQTETSESAQECSH